MPFKSKSQQRFMFAAEARGDLPKGTARRWAHETPNIRRLPERVKKSKKEACARLAAELGRRHLLEKNAGLADSLINFGSRTFHWWAPAAAGAFLAGPGYRQEGALAGLIASRLGLRAGRMAGLSSLKGGAKFLEGKPLSRYADIAERITSGKTIPGFVSAKQLPEAQKLLSHYGLGGAIAGGAAGGFAAGRLLGAQNPYGMQPVFPGWGKENPMGIRPQ